MIAKWAKVLSRQKTVGDNIGEDSGLSRCLTLMDLTLLGVGSTLGLGVYVLAGSVAKNEAGPAVTISFLVAAVASAFAGICYAEFASRVPRAGSAYVYSYVCVGEFAAFIIGWNLVLEYVIGTASVARGLSNYIDTLTNGTMERAMRDAIPIDIDFLSPYPDFLSFGMVMILAVLLSVGVKESSFLNNIFTTVNMITILIVVIAGSIKANPDNWKLEDVGPNGGTGGFIPFGFAGIMAGAAKCFYGFVGFDCVATTGEEAKNPQRNIPLAIVISLLIIFLSYFSISTVLTLMWPYYDQDEKAPLPVIFDRVGWPAIKWIVNGGAVFALCTSLLGAMFPLPRVLYAMATDGLIFRFLARIHPRSQTPIIATLLSGLLAAIMATIFDLDQLIDMMSIGTLLAYTIVCISVLILRYEEPSYEVVDARPQPGFFVQTVKQLFNLNMMKRPSEESASIAKWGVSVYSILAIALCAVIIFAGDDLANGEAWAVALASVIGALMLINLMIIGRQPHSTVKLSFKVPLVPLIPALSIMINVYLMLMLDGHTWIRFAAWLLVGFVIYFGYGIRNSEEGKLRYMESHNDFKANDQTGNTKHNTIIKDKVAADDVTKQHPVTDARKEAEEDTSSDHQKGEN
ncbi:cationic amino acid transporter 2 isoform X2 [Anabrus simplex]|uniref:cationic amino acid transporter 2 isoform X2 n=1 Tax=Anabrus simplex TaxID=316456 RepID=UPI0035A2A192